MTVYYHSNVLPWATVPEEQRIFRKIISIILIPFFVIGLVIPLIHLPEKDRFHEQDIPPRFAQLILEKQKPKPKPKPVIKEPEKKKEEKPKVKEKEKPKKEPEKKEVKKKEEPKKPEVDIAKARAKASKSGLLAVMDELSDLRDTSSVAADAPLIKSKGKKAASSESQAKELLLSSNIKGSNGIDTSALKQATRTQTKALEGRKVEQVASPVEESAQEAFNPQQNASRLPRTNEQIALIMQKYKGILTRMHNIALRKDPTIEGKVVLEMTVAAAGNVLECKVASSEIEAAGFLNKLEARCKTFNFGPAREDMTFTYPIDFVPLT